MGLLALLLSVTLGAVSAAPPLAAHGAAELPTLSHALPAESATATPISGATAAGPNVSGKYFGARYYGSKIGRFTTTDPAYTIAENIVDPQRWNKYAYARNNPLRYVDPDGRAIDTIADIGFIGWDVFDMGRSAYRGEGISGTQWLALGGDILGAAIPFATGVGAAIRAGSKVEHAVEAGRAANHIIDAGQAEAKGGTYLLRDAEGQVARTGRSKDLARRAGEHRRAEATKDLEFGVDRRTDVYAEQRGREQVIHDAHKPPLNKVNPISPTNPRRQEYLDAGKRLEGK